jgi:protein-S-isoprenylcysteine O-methyltransferase Ste14
MEGDTPQPYKNKVHGVLVHSYSFYLLFFLIGVCFDMIFNLKVFRNPVVVPIGFIFLILGTFLVFWAQQSSKDLKKGPISKKNFSRGPYRFIRNPTNLGLLFLVLGFGMIINAFFVILSSFVSFVVAKFYFLKKGEKILAEKYGEPFLEYKKSVKF